MSDGNQLSDFGWSDAWAGLFEPPAAEGLVHGRVGCDAGGKLLVACEAGDLLCTPAGRLRHESSRGDMPAIGDWVAVLPHDEPGRGTIRAVLPRRSRLARKVAGGRSDEQTLAANVDTAFLLMGLDRDFNLRRLERYLALAAGGGVSAVVVLNKADLCEDVPARTAEVVAPGTPVLAISAIDGDHIADLTEHLGAGRTIVLLGSSGVGKSTLINRLTGHERQATGAVRPSDGRGRHTTTHRELLRLESGALLIDTPGLRELQLTAGEAGVSAGFADIDELAAGCRFRDCTHDREPGCAVQAAIASGELPAERFENYVQLQRELAYQARRSDQRLAQEEKQKWKKIHRDYRKRPHKRSD